MRPRALRTRPYINGMRSTILAVILIVAAGAAHARPIPGLAGNAGRMPETMSPGLQPPPSMPTPTPAQPIQRYSSPTQYASPSQSYDMLEGGMFHGRR
jgi:hypothetical protein